MSVFRVSSIWRPACAAVVLSSFLAGTGLADSIEYKNNPGQLDFTVDENWVGDVAPGSGDRAFINGVDGIVNYAYLDQAWTIQRFEIAGANGTSGGLELRDGAVFTNSVNGGTYVGSRGVGYMRIENGASMSVAGHLYIGWGDVLTPALHGNGNGTVTQNGGTVTGNAITIGYRPAFTSSEYGSVAASEGTYYLNGGSLSLTNQLDVGPYGNGQFYMNGGTLTVGQYLQIGRGGSNFQSNGATLSSSTGNGQFIQTGGDVIINRTTADYGLVMNHDSSTGGTALYEISGGSLTIAASNPGMRNGGTGGNSTFRIIGDDATINIANDYVQSLPASPELQTRLELQIESALSANGGISTIQAGRDISLNGILDVSFLDTPTIGDQFTIMTYAGELTGTFSSFDTLVDSPLGVNSVLLSIDYGTGNNSAVVLTVIPEPHTMLLMGSVASLCLIRRRRA